MKRIESIDIARGIVMIIMALDHTRDLIHIDSLTQNPTDLNTTSTVLFFTRWITHLCAPVFVFLSGVSAYLSFTQSRDEVASKKYLLTRGLWLILLDMTIINFILWFDVHFTILLFNVVATIGFGFIFLSQVLKIPSRTLGILGLCILIFHGFVPLIPFAELSLIKKILMPLFSPGSFPFGSGNVFVMGYPPIPWLGIMLVGFATGPLFESNMKARKKILIKLSLVSILLFLLIRSMNGYGDPIPWSHQKDALFTLLSFINVTKYPPSLDFCLLFLGILCIILFLVEGLDNQLVKPLVIYGRVPLFYFIVHFFILHILLMIILLIQGNHLTDLIFGSNFGRPKGISGLRLPFIYMIWLGLVISLYPLCRWFGNYKAKHPEKKWLRYI